MYNEKGIFFYNQLQMVVRAHSLSRSTSVSLSKENTLKLSITRQGTSPRNNTEDAGTSAVEKRLVTFFVDDPSESVEGGRILDGFARGHHHSSADCIDRIGGKTSHGGDSEPESELGEERSVKLHGQQGQDGVVEAEVSMR
jgi:hypothetical protein